MDACSFKYHQIEVTFLDVTGTVFKGMRWACSGCFLLDSKVYYVKLQVLNVHHCHLYYTYYISYPSFHPRYLYLHILSTRDSELGLGLPLRVRVGLRVGVINSDCSALALSCQCTTSHLQWPKTPRAAGQTGIFIACEKAVAALIRRDSEYRVRMFPSQLAVIMMSTALVSYSKFNLTCTWSGQGTLAVT